MKSANAIPVLLLAVVAPLVCASAAASTTSFGPVELRPGQSFEVCVSVPRSAAGLPVEASISTIGNSGEALRSVGQTFYQGDGRCFHIDYSDTGSRPIFALLKYGDQVAPGEEPVASACVINGVFPACPPPIEVEEINDPGGELTERVAFGPVRLKPDSKLAVCVNNLSNQGGAEVEVRFYRGRNAAEPFVTRTMELGLFEGGCTALPYERARGAPVFAELVYTARGGAGSTATLVRGAGLLNGIFEVLPGGRRFLTAVL